MKRLALFFSLFCLVSFSPTWAKQAATAPQPSTPATGAPLSIVRVNVTLQPFDFFRPWSKKAPAQRSAIGAILPGNRVLVTSELVGNATYVELETPDGNEKIPASVERVDYDCNLAIIKPSREDFLKGTKPLEIIESKVGDTLTVWQLENNGTLLSTDGLLTSAEVVLYPMENAAFLIYRLTSPLQPRPGSFTAPVVRDGALTGLVQRFDNRSQNADLIPAPVISHFLKIADSKDYQGFPKVGIGVTDLRDPQFRRYAGVTNGQTGGLYITQVSKDGAAEKAGIEKGDILLGIGDKTIDQNGNYDHPVYGKLSMIHLLATEHYIGDKLPFHLLRDGKKITKEVTLIARDPAADIIDPYIVDRAPRFYIVGGLVFQELSRPYLQEWGSGWREKAPDRFVYYDRYQQTLFRDDPREKIVILSQILPSPLTIGYEDVSGVVVKSINGVDLKSLDDVEKAISSPIDGFHRIVLEEGPGELILDAAEVREIEPRLQQGYGLATMKNLEPLPARRKGADE